MLSLLDLPEPPALRAADARALVIGFYAVARMLPPHSAAARDFIGRAHRIKAAHPAADGIQMASPEVTQLIEQHRRQEAPRHA